MTEHPIISRAWLNIARKNDALQGRCECLTTMTTTTLHDLGEHHHRMCPKYRTEKFARLFYYEDAVNSWVPVSDKIAEMISVTDQMENGDIIEIQFKRFDMTDEAFDSLPEE